MTKRKIICNPLYLVFLFVASCVSREPWKRESLEDYLVAMRPHFFESAFIVFGNEPPYGPPTYTPLKQGEETEFLFSTIRNAHPAGRPKNPDVFVRLDISDKSSPKNPTISIFSFESGELMVSRYDPSFLGYTKDLKNPDKKFYRTEGLYDLLEKKIRESHSHEMNGDR